MAEEADFNPGFKFDASAFDEPVQPAWEFGGALEQARRDQIGGRSATSIDHKILQRLEFKQSRAAAAADGKQQQDAAGKARGKQARIQSDSDDDDGDGADDDDEDDSEDAPLPGEEDDGSDLSDGDEVMEDAGDDDDEDGGESEGEEGEEAEGVNDEEEGASDDAGHRIDSEEEDDGEVHKADAEEDGSDVEEDEEAPVKRRRTGHDQGRKLSKQEQRQQQQQQQNEQQQQKRGQSNANGPGPASSSGGGFFAQTPEGTNFSAAHFTDLNLSRPLLKACAALGYTTPTPIQAACIPLALSGRDICGSAMTGSGKTAAFALPILERLLHRPRQVAATYVLILTPTRELAVQIHSMVEKLAQYTDVTAALIVGGLSAQVQASVLRKSPEIVVATPGRLIDHLRNTQGVGLEDLAVLVLDEADRLLEMGFQEEIHEIVQMAPKKRQTMLFSATFSEQVRRLAALSLKQPVRLAADAAATVPSQLQQQIIRLKGSQSAVKEACLMALCSRSFSGGRTIIFFKTKQRAHRAKILFGLCGLPPAAELHGDMTQAARLESLQRFRQNQAAFLLATDVAARGLDISGVQVVVNYDAPRKLETYLHRIGRTARAGADGQAITMIEDEDRGLLKQVVKQTGAQMQQRLVPAQAIQEWQAKIESCHGDIWRVLREERDEKELRKAEMEAIKMQNMLEHEDEIKARPARTWFQTERQKQEAKKRMLQAAKEGREDDDEVADGAAEKSKTSKDKEERKARKKAEHAAKEQEAGVKGKGNKLVQETENLTKNIKSVKSRVRELVQEGINPHKAAKIAAASISGVKRKAKSKGSGKGKDEDKLFSGDGTSKPGSNDQGDAGLPVKRMRGQRVDSGGAVKSMSKSALNKIKRGGKAKRAFKSKARFKRRK